MDWKYLLIAGAVIGAAFALRGQSTIAPEAAREKLKAGALLVDVRTPAEFAESKLPGAINIPLNALKTGITNHAPDKGRVILLHCQSGARSGQAEKQLRALGYTNVFNLGSFGRAQKVVAKTGR